MMAFDKQAHGLTDCILYMRVSSQAQVEKGQGLGSQETYCRQFAAWKGYKVCAAFFDSGVSGARFNRDGIRDLLAFLRKHKGERRFVVIVDDISRMARDIRVHMALRDAVDECEGVMESPSMTFGTDSHGRYAEYMQALGAQYFREQNTEQTIKRQTARLMNGYWPFKPPFGYVQKKIEGHGKVMVPEEPFAAIIREALEGFASGRFQSQAEVARFFKGFPGFPKNRFGEVTNEAANRILTRLLYAGYVEFPAWDVSLREGKHEGLITLETFNRIQDRISGGARVPARADISADFPLRGFVRCTCGKPLTACWSTSKTGKKHPYYMCFNKLCDAYRKSIPRAALEEDFAALLRGVQPSAKMLRFSQAVLRKAWDMHAARAAEAKAAAARSIDKIESQITALLDRILKVSNATVLARFEQQIDTLEKEKLALAEKLHRDEENHRPFDEMFELAMGFFSSPWNIWKNGRLEHKRAVLKLAFSDPPVYSRFEGFRTPKTSIVFSVLGGMNGQSFKMAERKGFEPSIRVSPYNGLANRRLQPLGHLSAGCSFIPRRLQEGLVGSAGKACQQSFGPWGLWSATGVRG